MPKKAKKIISGLRHLRPGSVLIIVIALLLMLAILGTVYLTSSRTDRLNSAQNLLNAQADMNAQGIGNAAGSVLVDDLNDPIGYLRGNTNNATPGAYHATYQGTWASGVTYNIGDIVSVGTPAVYYVATTTGLTLTPPSAGWQLTTHLGGLTASAIQPWLADRIPSLPDPTVAESTTGSNPPYWVHLTQTIPTGATYTSILPSQSFVSPDGIALPVATAGVTLPILYPTFTTMASGATVPALTITLPTALINPTAANTCFIAGDADGDGIADSLLFQIPGAYSDGLTWYAGVRIIDDNSAINANTAWTRDQDYDFASTPNALANWGFFQSNTGLVEMLDTSDSVYKLNQFRFNSNITTPVAGSLSSTYTASSVATPYDDSNLIPPIASGAGLRNDFVYITEGDAFYNGLIKRIANPGINLSPTRYQALPISDTASLASHFVLTTGSSPQSLLETFLPNSLFTNTLLQTTPFATTDTWWAGNFSYPLETASASPDISSSNTMPIRPLLVTRNPVSNYISPVIDPSNPGEPLSTTSSLADSSVMLPYGNGHYKGQYAAGTYNFNDIVLCNPAATNFVPTPTQPGYTFICNAATNATVPAIITAPGVMTVNAGWQLQPWSSHPTKANVNTATFRELYRAFWSAMAGNPSNESPYGAQTTNGTTWQTTGSPYTPAINPWRQFRTPLRDCSASIATPVVSPPTFTWMDSSNTMLLRSAIAAVNTLGMRDQTQDIISRTVYLMANVYPGSGTTVATPVQARVYSSAPQPVISEVYYNNDLSADGTGGISNVTGYVAVELYNPYPFKITLNNWQLGVVSRDNVTTTNSNYPNLTFQTAAQHTVTMVPQNDPDNIANTPPTVPFIPANGYLLLENFRGGTPGTPTANDATYRPTGSNLPAGGVFNGITSGTGPVTCNNMDVFVSGLQYVVSQIYTNPSAPPPTITNIGGELVILRPRRADGVLTSCADPLNTFNEGTTTPNLVDLVPVDSYDFSEMPAPTVNTGAFQWNYMRAKGAGNAFKATYPGAYTLPVPAGNNNSPEAGTIAVPIPGGAALAPAPAFAPTTATAGSVPSNFPPIQIYSTGMPGPNPVFSPGTNTPTHTGAATPPPLQFPFGTFARNADILNVPFVGAYRIQIAATAGGLTTQIGTANFLELNSLPMDCSFADDCDAGDDSIENIGRFCPIQARAVSIPTGYTADDYAWAGNIFNYLTVQSNNDDYTPTFDPGNYDTITFATTPSPAPPATKYPPGSGVQPYNGTSTPQGLGTGTGAATPATPVFNRDGTASDQTQQDNVGVDGLININTASWKVLSMLPMITSNEDSNWKADNEALAQVIVAWRDGGTVSGNVYTAHGPFMSIFDLNKVIVSNSGTAVKNTTTNIVSGFQTAGGWLNPAAQGTAPVAGDGTAAAYPPYSGNGLLVPNDPAFPKVTTPATGAPIPPCTEDYEGDFAVLNRISNLITTRSDTFTVYVVVEGWQNAGTSSAQLKVTRRYSFVADRSAINQDLTTRFLKTLIVPNN